MSRTPSDRPAASRPFPSYPRGPGLKAERIQGGERLRRLAERLASRGDGPRVPGEIGSGRHGSERSTGPEARVLDRAALEGGLATLPGWRPAAVGVERRYLLPTPRVAATFVDHVLALGEALGHVPSLALETAGAPGAPVVVTVRVAVAPPDDSPDGSEDRPPSQEPGPDRRGGVTDLDLELARALDQRWGDSASSRRA